MTKDGNVQCCSNEMIDITTGESIGWMYGMHIIYELPADRKCPRCSQPLGEESGEQGTESILPVD
jgi:hypothetical protein